MTLSGTNKCHISVSRKKREYGGGCKRPQFGMTLFFKNEKLEREDGEMSDRRKSGMSCPPLRPRRLGSYCTLPKYNLICALRHLAIHTRACTMTSTAVWPCITCLERQQGSLSFNNMQCIGVLMTHVKGITTPPPRSSSTTLYFPFSAGDVKQRLLAEVCGFSPNLASLYVTIASAQWAGPWIG